MKADMEKLERAFNPKCVVVVGDSKGMGYLWLRAEKPFEGKLYSVHVNPETAKEIEAMGIKNYPSLLDIPEPVDLVVVAAPRAASVSILEDCIKKGVAAAHFFTSGFGETQTEEGKELERQLKQRAEEANFHLIGPNCMGVFNPKLGIRQEPVQYLGGNGEVGFISQSGGHSISFAMEAHAQGVDINKSVSFGNGIILDSTDFLEYLGQDLEVKAIGMYVEGPKDGQRFVKVLKEVCARKPVVIWKGGRTEGSSRAIASHTGSLAISQVIWEVAMKQCGAVSVKRQIELIDTLKALLYLPEIKGDRVAIAGGGGGQSVAIADVYGEAGLDVPVLTKESMDEFTTFFSLVGGGCRNPIDTGNPNREHMERIMGILDRDPNIDNLVLLTDMQFARLYTPEQLAGLVGLMIDLKDRTSKPVMAIVSYTSSEEMKRAEETAKRFQDGGVPTFPSIERAATALRNAWEYYRLKNRASSY